MSEAEIWLSRKWIDNIELDYMISEIYYHELGQKWQYSGIASFKGLFFHPETIYMNSHVLCAYIHMNNLYKFADYDD